MSDCILVRKLIKKLRSKSRRTNIRLLSRTSVYKYRTTNPKRLDLFRAVTGAVAVTFKFTPMKTRNDKYPVIVQFLEQNRYKELLYKQR